MLLSTAKLSEGLIGNTSFSIQVMGHSRQVGPSHAGMTWLLMYRCRHHTTLLWQGLWLGNSFFESVYICWNMCHSSFSFFKEKSLVTVTMASWNNNSQNWTMILQHRQNHVFLACFNTVSSNDSWENFQVVQKCTDETELPKPLNSENVWVSSLKM